MIIKKNILCVFALTASCNAMINVFEQNASRALPTLTRSLHRQISTSMAYPPITNLSRHYSTYNPTSALPPHSNFNAPYTSHISTISQSQNPSHSIATDYGVIKITEPVLCKLFNHPALERLKQVEQYGVSQYVFKHKPSYSRYRHSIGVWALLRIFGASLEQQIAGLLHDVSHTVFSHAGDVLFKHTSLESSYQDTIHEAYLRTVGIDKVLESHGISFDNVIHATHTSLMLEQDLPDVCADRLDYNLQGGIIEGLLTPQDVCAILTDLHFDEGHWYFTNQRLAQKLADVSLYQTIYVWGGPTTYFIDQAFNRVLEQALKIKLISKDEIHFGNDTNVWRKLSASDDPIIQNYLSLTLDVPRLLSYPILVDRIASCATKFRGIDPLIKQNNTYYRLSQIDHEFHQAFEYIRERVANLKVAIPHELAELVPSYDDPN